MMAFTREQVILKNKEAGGHYFDRDTMRFFKSRIASKVVPLPNGETLFVTSEQGPELPRLYSLRVLHEDGTVDTVHRFQAFDTAAQAFALAKKIYKCY